MEIFMRRTTHTHKLALLNTLALLTLPIAAHADSSDQPAWLGNNTQITVGLSTMVNPRYAGSANYRAQFLPVLSVSRGIFFIDTTRGLGVQYKSDSGFYISQSFNYDFGRLQHNSTLQPGSSKLAGMGNVPGSVTSDTLIAQQITPLLMVNAEVQYALRDNAHRTNYRAGVEFNLLHTGSDIVAWDIDTHWGDQRYNQAFFGVTPLQSARSGFASFKPDSGLYAYSTSVGWTHNFTPHWSSMLQIVATDYTGNVQHSPILQRHTALSTTAAVTYSF
jgi:outer membrane protein